MSVHLQYALPGGRRPALVATFFGREPSQTIREDLRRLKQLLEAGEVPRATPERVRGGQMKAVCYYGKEDVRVETRP